MTVLEQVKTGRDKLPPRLLIYGSEGIGKSSLAAQAEDVIFIDTEGGLGEIDCARLPQAMTFSEALTQAKALRDEKHAYATLALDSCDWLERLAWEEVCREYGVTSIEKAAGGYGKGYVESCNRFRRLIEVFDSLRRDRGMAIILIAHAKVESFTDPEEGVYDRYSPRLHKHLNAMLTEWCDGVFFATRKILIQKAAAGDSKVAAAVGKDRDERILRCVGSPACVAKNRFDLPHSLDLRWSAIMNAMAGVPVEA